MKLYTEEQVRKLLKYLTLSSPSVDGYMDTLTPIELPSDEEIRDKSFNKFTQSNARTCFEEGAKWMKLQILNQKK